MAMTMLRARTLAGFVLPMLLVACGSSEAPDPAAPVAASTAPNPNADFTAAVPVGNNAAPARVQFRIGARPAVGQPLPVAVRVAPTSDVDKLQVFFEAESGLAFVDEAQSSFVLDGMKSGAAHAHDLQVLAAQRGVFLLKVNVTVDEAGGSKASEFAIPILVETAPAAPAPPAPATSPGG